MDRFRITGVFGKIVPYLLSLLFSIFGSPAYPYEIIVEGQTMRGRYSEVFLLFTIGKEAKDYTQKNWKYIPNVFDDIWCFVVILELGVVAAEAVINYFKKGNFAYRERIRQVMFLPIILIVSLILQRWVLNVPVWIVGGTFSMLLVYGYRVNNLIFEDEMTGVYCTIPEIIEKADESMYEMKKKFHEED